MDKFGRTRSNNAISLGVNKAKIVANRKPVTSLSSSSSRRTRSRPRASRLRPQSDELSSRLSRMELRPESGPNTVLRTHLLLPRRAEMDNEESRWQNLGKTSLMEHIFAWRTRREHASKSSRNEEHNELVELANKEFGHTDFAKYGNYFVAFAEPHRARPRASSASGALQGSGRSGGTGRAVAGLVVALGGMAAAAATGGRMAPVSDADKEPKEEYDAKSLPHDLGSLNRDCFIIPQQFMERFLPDGFNMALPSRQCEGVSVLRVHDPMLSIDFDFFEVAQEHLGSDLDQPPPQPEVVAELRREATERFERARSDGNHTEGFMLQNLHRDNYPFINYYVMGSSRSRSSCSSSFLEVATIARPPIQTETKRPLTKATGFIVCIYRVFKGDNRAKFERNWLFWTGARMLYRTLPKHAGLRRLTLHRSTEAAECDFVTYVLVVECTRFMYHVGHIANMLNVLRSRICGYTGIYRVLDSFF